MKTLLCFIFYVFVLSVFGQEGRKDTVQLDSTHVEKIKKMPMDTMIHNMPIVIPPKNTIYRKEDK